MTDDFKTEPSITFWILSGAALIWNLFGMLIYFEQVTATPESFAAANYTPEQIAFLESTPVWVTSVFAISVTAGVLGAVFLLLRKTWAVPLFVVSLASVLIQNVHSFLLTDVVAVFGTTPVIIQTTVIVIALGLVFYSLRVRSKGWLS